jgi:hypothetical protein
VTTVAAPYNDRAFWIKAKLFLNHAMDQDELRNFDERALWASLALELLAKAALARVSPLLIAEPSEDGTNLLMASGLIDGDARFNSVRAQTIYKRCHKAFKPFSDKEALTITRARNEYLHGTGIGFTGIPPEAWWPRYWAQASILVNALDTDLDSLVGSSRTAIVENYLAQNVRNIEHRVEMLIARAQQRLAQYRSGGLPARVADEWDRQTDLTAGLSHRTDQVCPACDDTGVLEGEDVVSSEPHYEQVGEEDFDAWVELTIGADYFSCSTCKLAIDGYELLNAADLPVSFVNIGSISDYMEPEYGND